MNGIGEGLLGLVEQDRVWRTAEGEVVMVDSMTPRHLGSVLRVLVAMEVELHGEWLDRRRASGDATADPVAGEAGGEVRAWFDGLPLVIRLRHLLDQHNRAQREARFASVVTGAGLAAPVAAG
jgi:hypothetical protein